MVNRVWIAANKGSADDLLIICKDSTKAGKCMQKFPTIGACTSHESQVEHTSIAKYCFSDNISKLRVTMLAKWMMTPLIIDIEYKYYSVHPFFLFINVTLVKNCVVNALIMYVSYNISYLMLSKEKQQS